MKAAVIREFGDAEVLKLEDVDTPKAKSGHIVIKVLAAGVNRLDHYLREGSITQDIPLPHILGADAAGEVAEIGDGVSGFDIGERVIPAPGFPTDEDHYDIHPTSLAPSFTLPGMGVWGTYAQYIEVPARFVVRDETGLPPEQVATLPMVLATSVRAVKEVGGVKARDHVLVHAATSGSGSMHIQVAKALGAHVATTIRDDSDAEFAKELGADLVINTSKEDFVTRVQDWTEGRGADVVIDNLAGDILPKSIEAARAQGVIVAFGFTAGPEVTFDIRTLFFGQKQLRGTMANDFQDLVWGLEQVKQGKIKPVLDRTLPLSDAAIAHRLIANNEVTGNLVLLPWAA